MFTPPTIPGFDGLLTLSRREGVDIRPTLLRVLTDLYVQTPQHTADEEAQYTELASRLIEQVDDATLAAVRGRLSVYPAAPTSLLQQLALRAPAQAARPPIPAEPAKSSAPELFQARIFPSRINPEAAEPQRTISMMARDAAELTGLFFTANESERYEILRNLATAPLRPANLLTGHRAEQAIIALEMAAYASDLENFAAEIADVFHLPDELALQISRDIGGEPLVCAMRSLAMPGPSFQRVLLFLDPIAGANVARVNRLSHLYAHVSERAALIMLAAWQGSRFSAAARAKHRPALYDDERSRARHSSASHNVGSMGHQGELPRRTTRG